MTLVTFAVFVHISADHMLTAETAFRALATFGMLTHTFNALPHIICHFLRSFVSIRRLEKFLNNDEIQEDIVMHNPSGTRTIYDSYHVHVAIPGQPTTYMCKIHTVLTCEIRNTHPYEMSITHVLEL